MAVSVNGWMISGIFEGEKKWNNNNLIEESPEVATRSYIWISYRCIKRRRNPHRYAIRSLFSNMAGVSATAGASCTFTRCECLWLIFTARRGVQFAVRDGTRALAPNPNPPERPRRRPIGSSGRGARRCTRWGWRRSWRRSCTPSMGMAPLDDTVALVTDTSV